MQAVMCMKTNPLAKISLKDSQYYSLLLSCEMYIIYIYVYTHTQ